MVHGVAKASDGQTTFSPQCLRTDYKIIRIRINIYTFITLKKTWKILTDIKNNWHLHIKKHLKKHLHIKNKKTNIGTITKIKDTTLNAGILHWAGFLLIHIECFIRGNMLQKWTSCKLKIWVVKRNKPQYPGDISNLFQSYCQT